MFVLHSCLWQGKVASTTGKDKEQRQFGQRSQDVSEIEGLNLLAKHKAERHAEGVEEEDEEDQWKMEEDQEDDGNDTDGWINVSSDEEKELHISDSDSDDDDDDADGKRKRRRKQKQPQIAENENEDEEEETITFNIIDDSDDDDGDVAEQDNTEGDGDDDQEEVARLQNLAAQQVRLFGASACRNGVHFDICTHRSSHQLTSPSLMTSKQLLQRKKPRMVVVMLPDVSLQLLQQPRKQQQPNRPSSSPRPRFWVSGRRARPTMRSAWHRSNAAEKGEKSLARTKAKRRTRRATQRPTTRNVALKTL